MSDRFGTDLRVVFRPTGEADVAVAIHDLEIVSGTDNLIQALTLRLLVWRGELAALGHPRYGSRVHELLGEPLDRANLELLRRHVRRALMADPRVADVPQVEVAPRREAPGVVNVSASVRPVTGESFEIAVELDVD